MQLENKLSAPKMQWYGRNKMRIKNTSVQKEINERNKVVTGPKKI